MSIKAFVITGFGFNSDVELAEAFRLSGAEARRVHLTDIIENPSMIHEAQLLGFPGGFSFGDHLGSGQEIANLMRTFVKAELERFIDSGKPVIGICNGFQVLVKLGLVPNMEKDWESEASLVHNESGQFIDSWVELSFDPDCPCVWTKGLEKRELPIRHGEGRFVAASPAILEKLRERKLIAARYSAGNPNGSALDIAAITDPSGRVLGIMPHPECFLHPENHPRWQREKITKTGLEIIARGVEYAKALP
jgi:phosphoribosylformylglycinamidine synthase subunit PurQ / glutaminase